VTYRDQRVPRHRRRVDIERASLNGSFNVDRGVPNTPLHCGKAMDRATGAGCGKMQHKSAWNDDPLDHAIQR
jgi:hypothetical protein